MKVNINKSKSIEEAIVEVCAALLTNEDGINKLLNLELQKLETLRYKIESGDLNCDEDKILMREIGKLIDSLIMYQWVSQKKVDSIKELVWDMDD